MTTPDSQRLPQFRILRDGILRGTGDADQMEQFEKEVRYVEQYVGPLGECLGLGAHQFAVLDEERCQNAMRWNDDPEGGLEVTGFMSTERRSLSEVVAGLRQQQNA